MPRQVLYEALVDPGWDGGGDGLAALPRISGTHSSSVAASQRANSRGWLKPGRLGAQTLAAARIHHGLLPSRSRSGFSGEAGLGLKALACHAQTFTWPRPWAYEVAGAEKRVPPGRAAVRCGEGDGSLSFRGEPGLGQPCCRGGPAFRSGSGGGPADRQPRCCRGDHSSHASGAVGTA